MKDTKTRREIIRQGLTIAAAVSVAPPALALSSNTSLSFQEYRAYDALGLAQLVKKGDVSAMELLKIAIARSEAVNPTINCMVEELFETARAAIRAGLPQGPFTGVPFLLKDLGMALQGTVTTNGSRFYKDARMDYSSTVVERYQRAGLVIFGKTASPEFGGTPTTESILFGDTRNPWDLSRSTGGSSGGSAAAVAAGILPLANGTDGGGSIRIPASCCGLFGMKPSRGRVPSGPKELSSIMSVTHAVSRSVRDSAALLDATRGPEPGQTTIAPSPQGSYLDAVARVPGALRIGLITTPLAQSPVDPECARAAANAARLCASLGHHVQEITLPLDPREFYASTRIIMGTGTVMRVSNREQQLGRKVTENDLEPIIWQRYQNSRAYTAEQLERAQQGVERAAQQMALLQQDYDILLSPTLATPPVKLGQLSLNQDNAPYEKAAISVSAFTMLQNATGQPAMSVPLHWTPDGLPVGVMFAGRYGEEGLLFQLAGQLERASPWFDKLPPL
jgi:Asp-tRNA(Asn)/Glu-tRNA(Gln) amidotransferase A subunit family amidase